MTENKTKPDQGPLVHKPVLRPALVVNPGALATGREAGNQPRRLRCCHTAKL